MDKTVQAKKDFKYGETLIKCEICGKVFLFTNKGKRFCSWECYVESTRKGLVVKNGDKLVCENCKNIRI
jgi:hypothetical protein